MGTAASLGTLTPIFDIESPSVNLAQDAPHDFLIRNTELGDALAEKFDEASEVVLMRGHGMALRAPSIRHAVFRAFYAKQSAVVQMQAAFLSPGLTQREVVDARATYESDSLLGRAWDLWVKQVDKEGEDLYVNDLRVTESDEDD
ncbi:class ii aldolase adducin-like protein [Moniliophthora roreri MCA 2997]|uniref:Class ii aldolase adducin-like protein n=1 Tax=Moniliophthora roreri (strain MCA 2997) TaxID=1381753 RepID=V2W202_MONRO|nr:class ii aldolase adducin-like protein [Moniliophthora roreri MCA 2997]